jgi:hypothetical protein|tara:strand:- start:2567 stop:2878 length:312 start_codon:yes stop_codon:yes gene_type:complete
VEVEASGIRLVCHLLKLSGMDRFVAASYADPQQVNCRVGESIVHYRLCVYDRVAMLRQHCVPVCKPPADYAPTEGVVDIDSVGYCGLVPPVRIGRTKQIHPQL